MYTHTYRTLLEQGHELPEAGPMMLWHIILYCVYTVM